MIDEIAGTGYDESTSRDIECTIEGCEWRFGREYDLQRHLASFHKIPEQEGDSEMGSDGDFSDLDNIDNLEDEDEDMDED